MNAREKVHELLTACGAILKRKKKHEVWELPNGKTLVRSSTPSDIKSDLNNLSDLKHALGVVGEPKPDPAPAKERREKRGADRPVRYPANNALAEALKTSGVRDEMEMREIRSQMAALQNQVAEMQKTIVSLHGFKKATEMSWWYQMAMRTRRWQAWISKRRVVIHPTAKGKEFHNEA